MPGFWMLAADARAVTGGLSRYIDSALPQTLAATPSNELCRYVALRKVQMLPVALTRYFADSWLFVESFTQNESVLVIRIEKEIGAETGIILFRQVSFLSLPQNLPGETMRAKPIAETEPEFWSRCLLDRDWFDSDDIVFEIESQAGPVYFVVAKSVEYAIRA
jgi:hypothetical protein